LRKYVAVCVALILALVILKSLHLGLRQRIENSSVTRAASETYSEIENGLDKSPPTSPRGLTAGAAPAIIYAEHYLNRAFLTKHTAPVFDSNGGDLIVVCASSHNGTILTPSDNYHNEWISLAGPTNSSAGADLRSEIWYAKHPKVGPNHLLTMNLSTGQALVISIFVVKGANSDPIDAVSTIDDDGGTGTIDPTSRSVRTTAANDLLLGFGKSSASEVWQAGQGFLFQPSASSDYLAAESGLAANPGIYRSAFAISSAATWQASVVAIRPAANPLRDAPIRLAWRAAEDNVGVARYEIERCEGRQCSNFSLIGTSRGTAYVDANVPRPATYRYRVRAVDPASNLSGYSNVVHVNEISN
jgi:hypothetical protein